MLLWFVNYSASCAISVGLLHVRVSVAPGIVEWFGLEKL